MSEQKPKSKFLRYAKMMKIFAWGMLIFEFVRAIFEVLKNATSPYFQSAWIRMDWFVLLDRAMGIIGILFTGVVNWLLLWGVSLILENLAEKSVQHTEQESRKTAPEHTFLTMLGKMTIGLPILNAILTIPSILQMQQIFLSYQLSPAIAWAATAIVGGSVLLFQWVILFVFLRILYLSLVSVLT